MAAPPLRLGHRLVIIQAYERGETIAEISAWTGCAKNTAFRVLRDAKIPIRRRGRRTKEQTT